MNVFSRVLSVREALGVRSFMVEGMEEKRGEEGEERTEEYFSSFSTSARTSCTTEFRASLADIRSLRVSITGETLPFPQTDRSAKK